MGTDFETRLEGLTAKYCALWWRSPTSLPDLGDPISRRRQRRNRRQIDRFTDHFEAELDAYPTSDSDRRLWLDRLHAAMCDFGDRLLPLGAAERRVIFSEDYFDATVRFVREARAFDPDMELADLSQALRNVWIMHLFQLLLDRRVAFTTPILAYSLLYPYTDNRLDDPALPARAKRAFCQRLERRLAGKRNVPPEAGKRNTLPEAGKRNTLPEAGKRNTLPEAGKRNTLPEAGKRSTLPEDDNEAAVFRLIGKIETELPRARYPDVYRSMLAIHRAQTRSLAQQDGPLCEAELLRLSVCKGGASVLADGYLVAGDLSWEEADFFFGYGVFLQLADDLQDAEQDRRCGHATLFSNRVASRAHGQPLDRLANRLVHFLDSVLASRRFSSGRHDVLRSLVRRSCVQLVVESAGQQPRCFSRRYLRTLGKHSMTRFAYWRKRGGGLLEHLGKIESSLAHEPWYSA